ncbi:hypothetical protein ACHAWF_018448 [Thalassiosira exigua]
MTFLTRLISNGRHLPSLSPLITMGATPALLASNARFNNFHTSASVQRPGWKPPRNPKIGITLQQLRMAARGQGRRLPICHAEQEKIMNALEAANYENHAIYKYVMEYDKCREDYELNHKGKDKIMMQELNRYLVQKRKKK